MNKIKKFDQHEEIIRKTAAEKNALESFIYQIKEHIDDNEFSKFLV